MAARRTKAAQSMDWLLSSSGSECAQDESSAVNRLVTIFTFVVLIVDGSINLLML